MGLVGEGPRQELGSGRHFLRLQRLNHQVGVGVAHRDHLPIGMATPGRSRSLRYRVPRSTQLTFQTLTFQTLAAAEATRSRICPRSQAWRRPPGIGFACRIQAALCELGPAGVVTAVGEDGVARWAAMRTALMGRFDELDLHGPHDLRHTYGPGWRTQASPAG
jgi:hypothetical protein